MKELEDLILKFCDKASPLDILALASRCNGDREEGQRSLLLTFRALPEYHRFVARFGAPVVVPTPSSASSEFTLQRAVVPRAFYRHRFVRVACHIEHRPQPHRLPPFRNRDMCVLIPNKDLK